MSEGDGQFGGSNEGSLSESGGTESMGWLSYGMKASAAPEIDLRDRVLDDVGRRRSFLTSRGRRAVRLSRVAMAATLLVGVGALSLARRANPEFLMFGQSETASIGQLDRSAQADAASAMHAIQSLVHDVRVASDGATLAPTPQAPSVQDLTQFVQRATPTLGDLSAYETPLVEGVGSMLVMSPSMTDEGARGAAGGDVWFTTPGLGSELGVTACMAPPLGASCWRFEDRLSATNPLALPRRATPTRVWLPTANEPSAP